MPTLQQLNEYREMCRVTAIYPEELAVPYLVLGLCSESVELIDSAHNSSEAGEMEQIKELGDCQWYVCRLAEHYGFDFALMANSTQPADDAVDLVRIPGLLANYAKKQIRDGSKWTGEEREEARQKIRELLVKFVSCSRTYARDHLSTDYANILQANYNKLMSRKNRGVLTGSGDNR